MVRQATDNHIDPSCCKPQTKIWSLALAWGLLSPWPWLVQASQIQMRQAAACSPSSSLRPCGSSNSGQYQEPMATGGSEFSTNSGCSRATDLEMALSQSSSGYQYGLGVSTGSLLLHSFHKSFSHTTTGMVCLIVYLEKENPRTSTDKTR